MRKIDFFINSKVILYQRINKMSLTYDQFINKVGHGKKFYKYINDNFNHNGFQYKLGINYDTEPFDPTGSCKKGGLYFTDEDNIHFFREYGNNLAYIELLPDALFYIDPDESKYKTTKFKIIKYDNLNAATYETFTKFAKDTKYFYTNASPDNIFDNEQVTFCSSQKIIRNIPCVIKIKHSIDTKSTFKIGNFIHIEQHQCALFSTNKTNVEFVCTKNTYELLCELFPMISRNTEQIKHSRFSKHIDQAYLFDFLEYASNLSEKEIIDFFLDKNNCVNICTRHLYRDPMEFYNIKDKYKSNVMISLGKTFIESLSTKISDNNMYTKIIKDIIYCTPCMIEFVDQTPELCKMAVSIHDHVLKYVKDQNLKNRLSKQYHITGKITKQM